MGAALFLDLPGSLPSLSRSNSREHIFPPFEGKDISYAYRFEQVVLRSLIGSTAEKIARRFGNLGRAVDRIVENRWAEDRQIIAGV